KPKIYAENKLKITTSIQEFEKYVPVKELEERLITFKAKGITPRMFLYKLYQRALSNKKHIVLPEGTDDRILTAAQQLIATQVVELTLLGNREEIASKILQLDLDLDLDKIHIVDPTESDNFEDY